MNVQVGVLKRDKPPFRAEHIGSLLRPAALLEQRARFVRGEIFQNDLSAYPTTTVAGEKYGLVIGDFDGGGDYTYP